MSEQYAKRDAAWEVYVTKHLFRERYHRIAVAAMHDCFNAGWEARKSAVDYAIPPKPGMPGYFDHVLTTMKLQ